MGIEQPFEHGIERILVVNWCISLKTPVCIRSGSTFKWKQTTKKKSRNIDVQFRWNESDITDWNDIQDLHYVLHVDNNNITPLYQVPASSLRGAIRSWSLRHLVEPADWPILTNIDNDESAQDGISMDYVRAKLDQHKNGLSLIASLFGLAFQGTDATENLSFASRLIVETQPFDNPQEQPSIDSNGFDADNNYGPQNAQRQIMLRGPVDRITHSAKEGGLHSFLEFSAGQCFNARLKILNPQASHLGLIATWEHQIDAGFLRLGAISSAGRGRLSIHQATSSRAIYALPGSTFAGLTVADSDDSNGDVLNGLLGKCPIPWDEHSRDRYVKELKNLLKKTE